MPLSLRQVVLKDGRFVVDSESPHVKLWWFMFSNEDIEFELTPADAILLGNHLITSANEAIARRPTVSKDHDSGGLTGKV